MGCLSIVDRTVLDRTNLLRHEDAEKACAIAAK